jgi:hypothetical protein
MDTLKIGTVSSEDTFYALTFNLSSMKSRNINGNKYGG